MNMLDVERMALILSKSSKTVADLKVRFPSLHEGMKGMLGNEMEKVTAYSILLIALCTVLTGCNSIPKFR